MKKIIVLSLIVIVVFLSCTIGLGSQVDLTGPTLTVTSPVYMENVSQKFVLKGTVIDNVAVKSLTITIEELPGQEWKYSDSNWIHRSNSPNGPIIPEGARWSMAGNGLITWELPIDLGKDANGEYTITATAMDTSGKTGAKAFQVLTVVIDNTPPILIINTPRLEIQNQEQTASDLLKELENLSLQDEKNISRLLNGDISFSWNIEEDHTLSYLKFQLCGDENNVVYYEKEIDKPTRAQTIVISPEEIIDPATNLVVEDKTLLQVVVEVKDAANNYERGSKGWFCYWPEADIPWIVLPLVEGLPENNSYAPGTSIQGQAHDDDGLRSISLSIYEYKAGSLGKLIENKTINLESEGEPKSYNWTIEVPTNSENYTLQASCIDKNGVESEPVQADFFVQDIGVPNINLTSPSANEPLFGNSAGTISFKGRADDDSGIDKVAIAWIKPGTTSANSTLQYLQGSYSGWNTQNSKTDGDGNKVWIATFDGGPTLNEGRYLQNFTLDINLFSDLGLNGNTLVLESYNFVLYVKDVNGKTKTELWTSMGDTQAPILTIDKIHINGDTAGKTINSSLILPAFEKGDEVYFTGTWSDDSYDIWRSSDRIGNPSLFWNSTNVPISSNNNSYNATTRLMSWRSDSITYQPGAVGNLELSLTDWGGNKAEFRTSFMVETDAPVLARISSDLENGAYTVGKDIDIYLDFNKAVTFSSSSGTNPSLSLSNDAIATYDSGNGSSRHLFRWTVPTNDNSFDIDSLNVTSLTANSNTWKDSSGATVDMTLPTGVNSLSGSKNIAIDTIAPTLTSYTTSNLAGYYNAGKDIYIQANFSEPITLTGSPILNLSSGGTAEYTARLSETSHLFTYKVGTTDTETTALSVESFNLPTGASIVDKAGNSYTPSGGGNLNQNLFIDTTRPNPPTVTVIDTTPPDRPTVEGISTGTKYVAQTLSISSEETDPAIEYTIDGTNWQSYSNQVPVSANGDYKVQARQTDRAGNISDNSTAISFTIDSGQLLTSITTNTNDGRYGTGEEIDITLNFRKEVTITGTGTLSLNLNTTPVQTATYIGDRSSPKTHVFRYTVKNGDRATKLDVTEINFNEAIFRDTEGTDVKEYVNIPALGNGKRLAEQKSIEIITGAPSLKSDNPVVFDGKDLILNFDREIYKGFGTIVLSVSESDYLIPAVLSEARFLELRSRLNSTQQTTLDAAYTLGTNGASAGGVPDLDPKYVLNYGTNLDNSNLRKILRAAREHEVSIFIASSAITRDGQSLSIALTGAYALPIKGVTYQVSIDEGTVVDIMSVGNQVNSSRSFSNPGVEPPVIRIEKGRERIEADNSGVPRAIQPLTVGLRMDCRTPNATIYYTLSNPDPHATQPIDSNVTKRPHNSGAKPSPLPSLTDPGQPTTLNEKYTTALILGDSTNNTNGYRYRYHARAQKGQDWSDDAHAIAYRSVLAFNPNGVNVGSDRSGLEGNTQIWLRGGDKDSGAVFTPGFPLSWDTSEYDKIRLMTRESDTRWYWVSWELYTTAYVGLLLGTTPASAENTTAYGPLRWGWGKNEWVPFKQYYPLFPGESRYLEAKIYGGYEKLSDSSLGRGDFDFSDDKEGGTEGREANP